MGNVHAWCNRSSKNHESSRLFVVNQISLRWLPGLITLLSRIRIESLELNFEDIWSSWEILVEDKHFKEATWMVILVKEFEVEMWALEINVSIFFTGILSLFTKLGLSNIMGNTILKICRSDVHLCWFYIVKAT